MRRERIERCSINLDVVFLTQGRNGSFYGLEWGYAGGCGSTEAALGEKQTYLTSSSSSRSAVDRKFSM